MESFEYISRCMAHNILPTRFDRRKSYTLQRSVPSDGVKPAHLNRVESRTHKKAEGLTKKIDKVEKNNRKVQKPRKLIMPFCDEVLLERTASDEIMRVRREFERKIHRHLGGAVARRKRGQLLAIVSLDEFDAIRGARQAAIIEIRKRIYQKEALINCLLFEILRQISNEKKNVPYLHIPWWNGQTAPRIKRIIELGIKLGCRICLVCKAKRIIIKRINGLETRIWSDKRSKVSVRFDYTTIEQDWQWRRRRCRLWHCCG